VVLTDELATGLFAGLFRRHPATASKMFHVLHLLHRRQSRPSDCEGARVAMSTKRSVPIG